LEGRPQWQGLPLLSKTNLVSLPTQILRPRGFSSLQSLILSKPRKLHGLLPPLSAFRVIRLVGFSVSKGIRLQSSKRNILSCASAPPRRLDLQDPLPTLLPSCVLPQSGFRRLLASLASRPFSISGSKSPSCSPPFREGVQKPLP